MSARREPDRICTPYTVEHPESSSTGAAAFVRSVLEGAITAESRSPTPWVRVDSADRGAPHRIGFNLMQRWMHRFVSAVVILVCAAGCATPARQTRPRQGTLTVGVTANGASASTLMLNIAVESTGIGGSVKADAGVFTSEDVPFGTHVVRLTGVPSTCRVDNGLERKITISEQRRFAVLRFDVRCD
jgi:hypothetical protein